jgi:eukaryotic-like serine/threonine-protein kinase
MNWLPDHKVSRLIAVADEPDFDHTPYRLIRQIAQGGMGTIFLARDTRLDREVAIKVLNTSEVSLDMIERMRREAFIIASLEHPGIVPIHDLGQLGDGRVFYVMKYVRGKHLNEYLNSAISLYDRLRLCRTSCEAVAFAHSHSIVHRDLKPENIMVGPFGEVLVMDWGIAKLLDTTELNSPARRESSSSNTGHGTILGTPEFMSPEQASGDSANVDKRSDVYALGAILKFLLSTTSPHLNVPKRLDAIFKYAMAEDPLKRYLDARELALEIDRFLDGNPVTAYRETLPERFVRWTSKHKVLLILVLTYLLLRTILIVFLGR